MSAAAGLAPVLQNPKQRPLRVGLVGNPNCGKSTLFNALTGRRQRVANFPGVTVDRAEGEYRYDGQAVSVIDLPGMYSISPESPDETIAVDVLLGSARGVDALDVIVLVLDAEHLERNLYLATEVLELGRPTVIALNRVDRSERAGLRIDVVELIHELGVVVVPVVATRGEGVDRLRHAVARAGSLPHSNLTLMPDADGTRGGDPDVAGGEPPVPLDLGRVRSHGDAHTAAYAIAERPRRCRGPAPDLGADHLSRSHAPGLPGDVQLGAAAGRRHPGPRDPGGCRRASGGTSGRASQPAGGRRARRRGERARVPARRSRFSSCSSGCSRTRATWRARRS